MFKQLTVVPLYLACQSLLSQNSSDTNISVVIETPSELPRLPKDLPSGYAVFPHLGLAYKVYRNQVTWAQAHTYCVGEGGNLAVIDSFEKVRYVMDLKGPSNHIHVGMHRFFDETEWVEVKNGLTPAMVPWRAGSYVTDKSRKCTIILDDGSGVLASDCNGLYYFVCELPIFKE